MRHGEGERHRSAEAVANQDRIAGDFEFLETVLDRGDVGIHQRQHARLRAVKARQVDQRDAIFGGQSRQHRIEGVAVTQQRMQYDHIAACPSAHRRQRALARGQLFKLHNRLRAQKRTAAPQAAQPYLYKNAALSG